jgi:hypothetical protein
MSRRTIAIALESGQTRIFAVAVEWPGWSRSGRDEAEALAALADYAPRYAAAVDAPDLAARPRLEVVERLPGNATTDFGAPGAPPAADDRALDDEELRRQLKIHAASWSAFEAAAAAASGRELRKGPRGGGRNVAKMTEHVIGAEEAYLAKLGSRRPKPAAAASSDRIRQLRDVVATALRARAHGEEPPDPSRTSARWSPRYFVRRSAWHALDHAWEIEDRLT